jgi:acetyl esterase/lipase
MRRLFVFVVAALSLLASGCGVNLITPPGPAPLRYRDDVFTTVTKTSDVTYGSATTQQGTVQTLKLDIYEPAGDGVAARPAIVWVHGGGFSGGDKTSPEIVDEANTFARKGYFNVSINYRLAPGGCSAGGATPECVQGIIDAQHDAQAAVRWLRANASTHDIDVNRIAIGGSSAGAITAENVAYDAESPGTSGNPGYSSSVQAAQSISGAHLLGTITAGEPPSLLFHGTADPLVPYQWAVNTVNDAAAAGVTVYLTTWQGGGHVPYGDHRQQILDQTRNFFYATMDLEHAAR